MRPAFFEALKAKSLQRLLPLVQAFDKVIPQMLSVDDSFVEKLWKSICCFWERAKKLWRCTVEFIRAIPPIRKIFAKQGFSEYFLEELLNITREGNMQVKSNAAHAFCLLLRQEKVYKNIDQYLTGVKRLKNSSSYYERVAFLEFAEAFTYHFSQKFLREKGILTDILSLTSDKVSTLRIRSIRVIARIITNVIEQKLLQKQLAELSKDTNKDVVDEATKALVTLKNSKKQPSRKDQTLEEQEAILAGVVTADINSVGQRGDEGEDANAQSDLLKSRGTWQFARRECAELYSCYERKEGSEEEVRSWVRSSMYVVRKMNKTQRGSFEFKKKDSLMLQLTAAAKKSQFKSDSKKNHEQ
eukprot:TRINITY_DN14301_c0_g1_i1.p1 TRINITY_DN14301_c0_g1~~TRINITY_DN14301_c0_g1_i1.p1  ORF type:complete len:357 (-),score=76.01 TRINITY_DN14301_c0_g1_i1:63-1133(-)